MTDIMDSCPMCGSNEVSEVESPQQVRADDGAELHFVDRLMKCKACGEGFYTRDQSLASSRAAAKVLREHEGLLPPERIRAIRERYSLTQADFERALRLGPKTVVRWESGTVRQSAIANSLLLAIEDNMMAFENVAIANGFDGKWSYTMMPGGVPVTTHRQVVTASNSTAEPLRFKNFRKIKPVPAKKVAMG